MKKFRVFFLYFFKILPKFSYFVNSYDCIGKITPKSFRLYIQPFFIQKRFEVNKKHFFSSETMRKSGNYE